MAKLLNYGDIVLPAAEKPIVLSIAIGVLLLIVLHCCSRWPGTSASRGNSSRSFYTTLTEQDAADPSGQTQCAAQAGDG